MNSESKQKEICEKFHTEFVESKPSIKCGVALSTVGQQPIRGIRHPLENGTTGWYIWAGEYSDDVDFYKPLHTKHIINYFPEIIPYLGLPPGWALIIDNKGYEDVWYDSKYLNI